MWHEAGRAEWFSGCQGEVHQELLNREWHRCATLRYSLQIAYTVWGEGLKLATVKLATIEG